MSKSLTPPIVILACALPPPVFGQSIVNAAVRDATIGRAADIIVADISAGQIDKSLKYHFTRLFGVAKAAWMIVRYANAPRRKIYMVTQVGYGIFYNHLLLSLARLFDYNIVLHHHDSGHTKFYRRSVALLAWLIGPDAVHVTLGPAMAEDLKRYKQVQNVLVSQNARIIPDPNYIRVPRDNLKSLIVGHMSNLSRAKGLNRAIESITKARSRGIDVRLILAGPCDGPEAKATVREASQKFGRCA